MALYSTVIRDRFDIIGFDPRGVGRSAPVRCLSATQLDTYFNSIPAPSTQAQPDASTDACSASEVM